MSYQSRGRSSLLGGRLNTSDSASTGGGSLNLSSFFSAAGGGSSVKRGSGGRQKQNQPVKAYATTNPWSHTFAIPLLCGRVDLPQWPDQSTWTDNNHIRIYDSQRPAVCAGLRWEIYLHPLRGPGNRGFALSVIPIDDSQDSNALPSHLKLSFTVQCSVQGSGSMSDPKMAPFTRELEDIPADPTQYSYWSTCDRRSSPSPSDSLDDSTWCNVSAEDSGMNRSLMSSDDRSSILARRTIPATTKTVARRKIVGDGTMTVSDAFKPFMVDLPWTIDGLRSDRAGLIEKLANWTHVEVFRIRIEISAKFVRKSPNPLFASPLDVSSSMSVAVPPAPPKGEYTGIMGAILEQYEAELAELQRSTADQLKRQKDEIEEMRTVESELRQELDELKSTKVPTLLEENRQLRVKHQSDLDSMISGHQTERDGLTKLLCDQTKLRDQIDDLTHQLSELTREKNELREEKIVLECNNKDLKERVSSLIQSNESQMTQQFEKLTTQMELSMQKIVNSVSVANPSAVYPSIHSRLHPATTASPLYAATTAASSVNRMSGAMIANYSAHKSHHTAGYGGSSAASGAAFSSTVTPAERVAMSSLHSTHNDGSPIQPTDLSSQFRSDGISASSSTNAPISAVETDTVSVNDQVLNLRRYSSHLSTDIPPAGKTAMVVNPVTLHLNQGYSSIKQGKGWLFLSRQTSGDDQLKVSICDQSSETWILNCVISIGSITNKNAGTVEFESGNPPKMIEHLVKFDELVDYQHFVNAVTKWKRELGIEDTAEEQSQSANPAEKKDDTGDDGWSTALNNNSFGDMSFDSNIDWSSPVMNQDWSLNTSAMVASGSDKKSTVADRDDDDNCVEVTFKPIVSLKEQDVQTGTENETELAALPFKVLYRWGPDVSGVMGWKSRATLSTLYFYKDENKTGKTRLICREKDTLKLRLNHFVPHSTEMGLVSKGKNMWNWTGIDTAIAFEDDSDGFCKFAIKFSSDVASSKFEKLFNEAAQGNRLAMEGGSTTVTVSEQKDETNIAVVKSRDGSASIQSVLESDNEEIDVSEHSVKTDILDDGDEMSTEDEFEGDDSYDHDQTPPKPILTEAQMKEMEEEQAKATAVGKKASALFGNSEANDDFNSPAKTTDWGTMDVTDIFSAQTEASVMNDDVFGSGAEMPARGLDLEFSGHVPKADVSFGVSDTSVSEKKDQSPPKKSVWDWNADAATSAQASSQNNDDPPSQLGSAAFKFADDSKAESTGAVTVKPSLAKTATEVESPKTEAETSKPDDGFAHFGGGASDGGWASILGQSGGNDDDWALSAHGGSAGSDSFGAFDTGGFDFGTGFGAADTGGGWGTDKSDAPKPSKAKLGSGEDNYTEITFKPIVSLKQQKVETGHENETLIAEVKFKKLHRYGKDVTGVPSWKQRATDSKAQFWQAKSDPSRIRIVVREAVTEKLRLNHYVPYGESSNFQFGRAGKSICQWIAGDPTIREEEDDPNYICPILLSFYNDEDFHKFGEIFQSAIQHNRTLD